MNQPSRLDAYLDDRRREVDAALSRWLDEPATLTDDPSRDPSGLRAACRHALMPGGKRLRPALTLAAAEASGARDRPIGAACAVEMVHAYSLVHDDLPAMDDAAERRGRPSVHRAFGEAVAILAGDALLTAAFELLAGEGARADCASAYLLAARELAQAAGWRGMVGGQALDLEQKVTRPATLREVELCGGAKTAALFSAACAIGALVAGSPSDGVARLRGYGFDLGLAFQHKDDLADGDHAPFAADARRRARELCARAAAAVEPLGEAARPLIDLATRIGSSHAM